MKTAPATTLTITMAELQHHAGVGVQRMMRAIHKQRSEPHGHPKERGKWDTVIEGAIAEAVFSKSIDHYWSDTPELDYAGDVGPYHVRSTDLPHGGLTIYPTDPDDGCFVLVITAAMPTFTIAGFVHPAGDFKRDEYLAGARLRTPDAYLIPQRVLQPLELLPDESELT